MTRPNQLWIVDFTYVSTWAGMAFTGSNPKMDLELRARRGSISLLGGG